MAARKKTSWQRWKESLPKKMRKLMRLEARAKCVDRSWLESMSERVGECLVWRGHVRANSGRIRPYAKRRQHAGMFADRAMWEAVRGSPVPATRALRTTCKNELCIEPSHLVETNRVLEAAKKKAGYML